MLLPAPRIKHPLTTSPLPHMPRKQTIKNCLRKSINHELIFLREQILGKLIMFHSKIVFRQTTHVLNKNWSLLKENYFPIERKEIRWKNLSLLLQSTVICGKISSLLVAKITSWKNYFLLFLDKFVKIGGNWKNCRF